MSATTAKTANGLRVREARRTVNLAGRMRMEGGWCDVTLRNVSSMGFMALCNPPPQRGSYIEVWRDQVCIVGYVVWSAGSRFGVRSQTKIDISALTGKHANPTPGTERRKRKRPTGAALSSQDQATRSRQIGRAFEFAMLIAGGMAVAVFLASLVGEALKRPFATIESSLAQPGTHTAPLRCKASERREAGDPNCPAGLQ